MLVKRYGQYCPVAHALDQIGDRWALLIVRELMLGQRRFTDLADALPGMGSNILTSRLRDLEGAGIVAQEEAPAAVGGDRLRADRARPRARRRARLARGVGRSHARHARRRDDCWSMYAVHARFRPDAAVDGVYEVRFEGGETISLEVRGGELSAAKLPAAEPTLSVELAPETLHAMIEGALERPGRGRRRPRTRPRRVAEGARAARRDVRPPCRDDFRRRGVDLPLRVDPESRPRARFREPLAPPRKLGDMTHRATKGVVMRLLRGISVVGVGALVLAAPAAAGTIVGTPRADVLRGTHGADRIIGGKGNDRLYGLAGNDVLTGGAGFDRFFCGAGRDTANAERGEPVAKDCEIVKRAGCDAPPPLAPAPASAATAALHLRRRLHPRPCCCRRQVLRVHAAGARASVSRPTARGASSTSSSRRARRLHRRLALGVGGLVPRRAARVLTDLSFAYSFSGPLSTSGDR